MQLLHAERFTAKPPALPTPCGRCQGSGRFIGHAGKPLGECFACRGSGKASAPAARVVADDALRATFDKLLASGLKRVKLRMGGFQVKPAPAGGRNAGALYVTEGETYLGKIAGGRFLKMDCCSNDVAAKVVALVSDPEAAIKASGVATGTCAVCGLTLTDPVSIEMGIGPICAGRMR